MGLHLFDALVQLSFVRISYFSTHIVNSVTRLGYFCYVSVTNVFTKVAKNLATFWGNFEKVTITVKVLRLFFGQLLK